MKLCTGIYAKLLLTVGLIGTKFDIVYDSVEDLKKGKATVLPEMENALSVIPMPKNIVVVFLAGVGLAFENGDFNLSEENALNKSLPHIKPLKVKDALEANFRRN